MLANLGCFSSFTLKHSDKWAINNEGTHKKNAGKNTMNGRDGNNKIPDDVIYYTFNFSIPYRFSSNHAEFNKANIIFGDIDKKSVVAIT